MDPDQTLKELRKLFSDENIRSLNDPVSMAFAFGAAAAHFEALDKWLSDGSFCP